MKKKRFLSVLLSVCMVFTMFPMVVTVAGTTSGTAADTLCGGWTTIASTGSNNCYQPFGIAMYEGPATDSDNGHQIGYGYKNVYVADSFSSSYNIIRKWDGSSWSTISGPSGGFGSSLVGAAVNQNEDIFIACAGALTSKAIWKYDSSTAAWTDITAGHQFQNIRGIAVSGNTPIVLNMNGGTPEIAVYELNTAGEWSEGAADTTGISNFDPVAIALPYDKDIYDIYLLDSNGKIYKCVPHGTFANPTFTLSLVATAPDGSGYSGLTVLPEGTQSNGYDFYVTNSSNKCVEAILRSGSSNPSSWEKMQYGTSNQFNSPAGIAVNCDGNMYVADNYLTGGNQCDSKIAAHSSIPAQLVWSTQPGGGITGGTLSQQPVLMLKDKYSKTKTDDSEDQVTVSIASGSGTLNGTTTVTLSSGVATFSDLGITGPGTYTLTANCGGITNISASFTITNSAAAAQSTVTANPASVTADGSSTSTITVTLNDSGGSPVSGKAVSLSQNGGHSAITTISGTTNANGQASFTVKNTKAETVTYTATDKTDNVTVTQTAQVQFAAGSVNAAQSTVAASPQSVTADGSGTSTITVTLKDSNANPVSGKTVALSQNSGGHSTIITVSGTTNASGRATFTVKNATAEAVTYTATDQTDNVTVTQTAQVQFVAGSASKLVFTGAALQGTMGDRAIIGPITVTAEDQNGNVTNVSSDTVVNLSSNTAGTAVFSKTSGGQAVTSITIAAGSNSASFFYGDSKAGTPTITASASGLTSRTQSETITAAPALSVSAESGGSSYTSGAWTKNSVSFDLSDAVQNPDSITYQVSTDNGNSWTDLSSGASGSHGSYTVSTAGTQNLQFRIESVAGSASNIVSYTVNIDTTAPGSVSIGFSTSPFKTVSHFLTLNYFFGDTVTANFSATDSGSGIGHYEYQKVDTGSSLNANGWQTGSSLPISPDYTGTIYVRAVDLAGNVSGYVCDSLAVDKTAPTITANSGKSTLATTDPNASIPVTAQDNGAGIGTVTYQVNGAMHSVDLTGDRYNDVTHTYAFNIGSLPDGNYDVLINAQDNSGNSAATATVHVTKNTQPTVTDVSVTPGTVPLDHGGTQQFTADISGTNLTPSTSGVVWSVSGNKSGGTVIDSSGKLTVAPDESAASLTVTVASNNNRTVSGKAMVTVGTSDQTGFGFSANTISKVCSDAAFAISASGGQGDGAMTYSVTGGSGAVSLSGNTVTPLKAGTAVITATKAADGSFNQATATLTINVGKGTPAITTLPTASQLLGGGLLSGVSLSGGAVSVDGTFAWTDPDTSVSASGSYSVTFTPKDTDDYNTVTCMAPVTVSTVITNGSSGVMVDLSGVTLPDGVTSVTLAGTPQESAGGTKYSVVMKLISSDASLGTLKHLVVYDLELLDQNGNPIEGFTGTITVKIPVPMGMSGGLHVLWYDDGAGRLTDMNATQKDGYLIFETTHFSYYAVAQLETSSASVTNPKTGGGNFPVIPLALLGMGSVTGMVIAKRRKIFRYKK